MRLAVFGSGNGSNCRAIYKAIQDGHLTAEIKVIISDQSNAGILDFARAHHIPSYGISKGQFGGIGEFHETIIHTLKQHQTEMIILAGYMKKIGKPVLQAYPDKVLNMHPALLPAFGGKGLYGKKVHQAVLDYGAKITGITVHLVDEEYDHGPVVLQKAVEVRDDDTVESLSDRVLRQEHEWYYQAIQLFAEQRVTIDNRKVKIIN